MYMNRFIFSSLVTLGIACTTLQGNGVAAEDTFKVGVAPKVLNNVRNLPQQPMVRVLVLAQKPSLQVEVKGSHNVYDPYNGKKLDAAFLTSSYTMTPTSDGLMWGQEFPGVFQLLIVPDTKEGIVLVDGIQYAGAVAFYQVENRLAVVNWVSLEDFTSALLSTTMIPKEREHKEALAAFAIALRSLAYEQLSHSTHQFWDVRGDECGYRGRAIVRLDLPFQEAMRSTKNIILEPKGNESLSLQSVSQLLQTMPYSEAVDLAEGGKDASSILEKYMPGRPLRSVPQK